MFGYDGYMKGTPENLKELQDKIRQLADRL